MNNNFDFPNNPQNQINMTDSEIKSHKRIFSRLGLAFLSYIAISQGLSIVLGYVLAVFAPNLLASNEFVLILSSFIQYFVAFPVLYIIVRPLPKGTPTSTPVGVKRFLKYAVLSMFFMYVGNYISTFVMTRIEALLGRAPENAVNEVLDNTNILVSALIVGIIGPIFEELMFRKIFVDRLIPYGDKIAMLFPALIFGLFHGNLYQFFYAFFIGVVFSYIYIKTGKIIYSIVLHIFINLFCGVFPSLVFSMLDYEELIELVSMGALTEEYIAANTLPIALFLIYSYGMIAMAGIGMIVLFKNIKNIYFNKGEIRFPKGTGADIMFFNVGSIALIASCILLMAYSTFA